MNTRTLTSFTLSILVCLLLPATAISGKLEPYHDERSLNFSLTDLKAKTKTLSDYKNKVVLVNFWASWCPPCIYEMPKLTKLKQQFADQPFEILTVNVGEKKYKVRKFVKLIKLELPVLLDTDSDTFNNWGVKTLPTSFLVDANGRVQYRVQGDPGWDDEQTFTTIKKLIAETTSPDKSEQ